MASVEFYDLIGEIEEDPRGLSFFPWRSRVREPQDILRTFHLISISPGQVRGNHLHPGHEEWLYPFHGKGLLIWEEETGIREKEVSGDRVLIRLAPGVAHALRNPGPEILYLLGWRQAAGPPSRDPETLPRPLYE
jgi:quercetin dioxygenase-like cupin family protein